MSQWRLNDDDFEDDDDYSKTNVEKKADAPWTERSQGHFKVAIEYYCDFKIKAFLNPLKIESLQIKRWGGRWWIVEFFFRNK